MSEYRVDVFPRPDGTLLIDAEGPVQAPFHLALEAHCAPVPQGAFRDFSIEKFRRMGDGSVRATHVHTVAGFKFPVEVSVRGNPSTGILMFDDGPGGSVRGSWIASHSPAGSSSSRVRLIQELSPNPLLRPLASVLQGIVKQRMRRAMEDLHSLSLRRC
jgi:hypothetical protein